MAIVYDFEAARQRRDAKPAFSGQPGQGHPPAALMTLRDPLFDSRVHAAIPDRHNDVAGFWVTAYPAGARIEQIPYELPDHGAFVAAPDFKARFRSTGAVEEHPLAHHFTERVGCTPSDPMVRPEYFFARLDRVDKVMRLGWFRADPSGPILTVRQGDYIFYHAGQTPEIVGTDDALKRLRQIQPDGGLKHWHP